MTDLSQYIEAILNDAYILHSKTRRKATSALTQLFNKRLAWERYDEVASLHLQGCEGHSENHIHARMIELEAQLNKGADPNAR